MPKNELVGLRGWLLVLGFAVILAPFRIIGQFIPVYYPILTDGTWKILTNPTSASYHVLWKPLIIGEIIINSGVFLVWIYVIYLFFTKNKLFPLMLSIIVCFTIFFIIVDAYAISFVLPNEPMFDEATLKSLAQTIVWAAIWLPYTLVSKRVHATFVN